MRRTIACALLMTGAAALSLGLAASVMHASAQEGVTSYIIVGDAIPQPLTDVPADPVRGRRIVFDRRVGNCLICHRVPDTSQRFQGDVGPDLSGVGRRLTPGQIRLHIVDQRRLNPASVMPPYHRIDGLRLVAPEYAGKPVLTAREIEDVVAYLASLRD
jgi:sulfur-oxidizing protein SoxX